MLSRYIHTFVLLYWSDFLSTQVIWTLAIQSIFFTGSLKVEMTQEKIPSFFGLTEVVPS